MKLPYFLGCPSWNDAGWRGSLYPSGLPASDYLARYCSVFNTVEGNTTLYAWPSEQKIERWAAVMPENFRFCAKLPREISQASDLGEVEDLIRSFRTPGPAWRTGDAVLVAAARVVRPGTS